MKERREGKGVWFHPAQVEGLLARASRGDSGPARESGRFDVPEGKDVEIEVKGGFTLRIRAEATFEGDGRRVAYRFAWEGAPAAEGAVGFEAGGAVCFIRPKGGLRYDLLMCAVRDLRR